MDLLLACALSVLQAAYAIEYFVTDRPGLRFDRAKLR